MNQLLKEDNILSAVTNK